MYSITVTLDNYKPSEKRKYLLGMLMLLTMALTGHFIYHQANQIIKCSSNMALTTKTAMPSPVQQSGFTGLSNSLDSGWKTYSNKEYGFEFKFPPTWSEQGEVSKAINRKGEVMSIQINFVDSVSNSAFFIEYHLEPYGAELFKYVKAQFDSSQGAYANDAKQINVAGQKAIEAFTTMSSDIKGNIINPPLRIIFVHFLDKQHTGEFDLRFKTPMPIADAAITKFNEVLPTFKFIN